MSISSPGRVAERVVHVLEAVEVEQRDRRRPIAAFAGEQAPQLLLQRQPVGQAGQLIIMGEPPQLLLGLLAARDVLVDPGHVADGAVEVVHRSGGDPDVDQ
jgi:hypothetical protein